MEQEDVGSTDDLRQELEFLESNTTITDKEAEDRFIAWYEDICKERMAMLEAEEDYKKTIDELETAEEGYRTRIKDLENSTVALVKTFEEAETEIKVLRDKYEANTDDVIYAEPYNVVSRERNKLLQREIQNKKQIKTLEDEVKMLRNYVKEIDSFQDEKKIKVKSREQIGKLVVITSTERLKTLEHENEMLKYMLQRMNRRNKSLASKLKLAETKIHQTETVTVKSHPVNTTKEKLVINKKCLPTFLPRLQSASSGFVSDSERSRSVPSLPASSRTPALKCGLGYGEIHSNRIKILKRQTSRDTSSSSSSRFEGIYKYMI